MSFQFTMIVLALSSELAGLGFLSGGWKGESGKATLEEHWTDATGGMMLGVSRTIVSGKTVAFEFLRIETREDGIFYVAQPNGRTPPTYFKLTKGSGDSAVFENPGHDHPKLIRYRRNADGSLTAEVEGDGGKQEFHFRSIAKP
ncbi:MAG: DUF6265 family protein [Vicinamibacteria bacterium]